MNYMSAPKLSLLTAPFGPILKGNYATFEQQCEYFRQLVPKASAAKSINADLIYRWRRQGVKRTKPGDNLSIFCSAVRSALNISEDSNQIAQWILDDKISVDDFAKKFKISKTDFDYIMVQYYANKTNVFPSIGKMIVPPPFSGEYKPDSCGIYDVYRYKDASDTRPTQCVLIIDRYVEVGESNNRKGYIFSKLYIPQPQVPKQYTEYFGMLIQPANHKYFYFQSISSDIADFVTIITDIGSTPPSEFYGVYASANIEGMPEPGVRNVKLVRKYGDVTDEKVNECIQYLLSLM